MLLQIPHVLTTQQLAECSTALTQAQWIDGRVTAGYQGVKVKSNLQLPQDAPARVLRADPVRKGLLYAATEYRMWISLPPTGRCERLSSFTTEGRYCSISASLATSTTSDGPTGFN